VQAEWVAQYLKRTGNTSPWMGFHGPRDADPRWGDAGYNPEKLPVAAPAPGPSAGFKITDPNPNPLTSHTYPALGEQSFDIPKYWDAGGPNWDTLNSMLPVGPVTHDNSKSVTIGGTTNNITVTSPDPQSAASMVGVHLDRSANDLSRNLQGAFQ
jgi:hypothetical protein